jgi:hypothetical protein
MSHKLILNYDEQAARIKVLEKALVASEQDYENLKAGIDAYDLQSLETSSGIQELLGTFSTFKKAVDYGNCLIEAGEEVCWTDKGSDGLSVSGPYKLIIDPEFKREKK